MAVWQRFSRGVSLSAASSHDNTTLITNAEATNDWESRDLVVVDGIITLHTDTDNLCGARLIVAHELLVDGDLSDTNPQPFDDMIYYSWFFARGPSYFRLNSKKTIPVEHRLWLQLWKEVEADATQVNAGLLLYVQEKG